MSARLTDAELRQLTGPAYRERDVYPDGRSVVRTLALESRRLRRALRDARRLMEINALGHAKDVIDRALARRAKGGKKRG